jgi:thiol-disulfide isomerase/thioredoxin
MAPSEPRSSAGSESPSTDRPQRRPTGALRAAWHSPWRGRIENALLTVLVVFAAWRLLPQLGAWIGIGPVVGSAPEVVIQTLDGESLDLRQLRGEVVVVNFWASWCAPCRWEMPALQNLHEAFGSKGLTVLGVSIDARPSDAVEYATEKGISYPIAVADATVRAAFGGLRGVPTTFLIDREGVIRHRVFGFFAPPALSTAVRRLLDEERPALNFVADPLAGFLYLYSAESAELLRLPLP